MVRQLHGTESLVAVTARDLSGSTIGPTPFVQFSVGDDTLPAILGEYGPGDFVLNCIGIIKHRLDESDNSHRLQAIRVNAEFPYHLTDLAEHQGFRIIQIATDCVYAGTVGTYNEQSSHDALDIYGKSKSLGEVPSPQVLNLRCSIIGRELVGHTSLVEWLLSQPDRGTIRGYSDHLWNGITTDCFARIAVGLISSGSTLSGTFHVVPADIVSKNTLSRMILDKFGREDVSVAPTVTGDAIDRTLSTLHPEINQRLWELANFQRPPTIDHMVQSLVV